MAEDPRVEQLRNTHIFKQIVELLFLIAVRIEKLENRCERIENHLHEKFGERP